MQTIYFANGRQTIPVNPKTATSVAIAEHAPPRDDGSMPEPVTTLFPLPLGTKEFASQRRTCGDWYVMIALDNGRARCAVGPTQRAAIEGVLAQFESLPA